MSHIVKTYKQPIPALRFIGKKYTEKNPYGHWGEFFGSGWFDAIEKAMGGIGAIQQLWADGGGYVGLEHRKGGEMLDYWIGMFTPPDTEVPEGFDTIDFPAGNFGVCWLYGKEADVHNYIGEVKPALENANFEILPDHEGAVWQFENGTCPRFTTPDENGNVILDYCYFVK